MNAIERRVTQGLRAYGDRLGVTTEDVDRLEGQLDLLEPASRDERRGRFWQGAIAACAVTGLVLGALALHHDLGDKAQTDGPPPVTLAQLEGIWRVAGSNWLWRFTADGRVTLSGAPDLLTGVGTTTAFTVRPTPGGFTSENDPTGLRGCSAAWAVIIAPEGRMSARGTGQTAACTGAADPPDGVWEFTRLSPVSVVGAATLPDRASQDPLVVTDLQALTGTWLLRGTGTLLTVDASARYAIQDLGAAADPQTGSVSVGPSGRVTFTPQNTLECAAVYRSISSTDTALDTELAAGSCTRLAATSDTWIRLN